MSDRLAATAFAERLLRLSLATWHRAALGSIAALDSVTESALGDVLRTPDVAWDAWCVRDDVEAAFWRFECPLGLALLRPRGRRRHVRVVSDRAALAVLVHDLIPASDFDRYYGGFTNCIPVAELYMSSTYSTSPTEHP